MQSQSIPFPPSLLQLPRLSCLDCGKKVAEGAFLGLVTLLCRHCKYTTVFLDGEPVAGLRRDGFLHFRDEGGQPVALETLTPRTRTIGGVPYEELVARLEARWAEFQPQITREPVVATGLRFRVFMRDGFSCRYCGRTAVDGAALEADHVHPRSAGGQDTLENLVTACWECNSGKRAKIGIAPP